MGIFEAIILGIVQGLTEFLPISSSAHLRIVGDLFPGLGDPGVTFTAVTQIGTEAAVIMYFWKDIVRIISAWFMALPFGPWKNRVPQSDPDVRLGWIVIFGTMPIVVLGLLLEDAIDSVFRNMYITALMLAVFAVFLGVADRISKRRLVLEQMSLRDGIILGFAQAMALIPGVSRSGGTITVGLLLGYTRSAAARVSFLLAIPAVLGSGFYRLLSDNGTASHVGAMPTLVATLVAFVVGYAVIVWFLRLIETTSYMPFVVYRLVVAVAVVALLSAGLLHVY
ncbi:undecaprenyl-diphosphate phosphatase [Arcanobacterium haemolyticum]|uniref:Undecaprenyl-diphosphatase n=1 Tax=Arcanobacterium haemolyticum (strain ATCC 9345 / DSM 20595 / CCM 5947 / CCUG 17215 / LMG 16163 / NBRC 15585 / NCTC 8452 / 11018) TaxID=644284 RepID=D7BNY5_ARCHD|nr:undecaprenyl-diphosphate phosphatase [Arcanobacterium haemolyticum]ADH92634.1 undecaprenol kinase [Arcanobacterium haemolyticum DSM 20595]QCX46744.1 undecaprenyl-diphosphate phosphatase [Arcanobacterium haemolyticum]SQH28631.1 Undecaprenyl-diphosphatase [Arcanobacterium haemolyticum]